MAVLTYKCPNCSGPLSWDAKKSRYFCDYCNSVFTEEEIASMMPASETALLHYTCPSCGAEIMTEETTAASFCYYCHNPVVLSDRLSGDYKPDYVLPFEIDREQAIGIFKSWVSQHRYIPSDFYSEKQIDMLSAVYFPYWVYNCKVASSAKGEGKRLKTWVAGRLQYTETSVYDIDKKGSMQIENVTRIALKKASRVLSESVMPFGKEKLKPFSYAYLQGYQAEMRDISKEEFAKEVEEEVKQFAAEQLAAGVRQEFQTVSIQNMETSIRDADWKYALMPVWTLTYRDGKDGKLYYFSINGQSGKTCGELPVDKKKLLGLFLSVFVPLFLACLLLLYFIN